MKTIIQYVKAARMAAASVEWTLRRLRATGRAALLPAVVGLCFVLGAVDATAQGGGSLAAPINIATISGNEYLVPAAATRTDTFYFTGTSATLKRIRVAQNSHAVLYLKNLSITTTGAQEPPIRIEGINGNSWSDATAGTDVHIRNPVTNVDVILDGTNYLENIAGTCAVFQVDHGAQINIKSKDEIPFVLPTATVNAAGQLTVKKGNITLSTAYNPLTRTFTSYPNNGNTGAAIGGPSVYQGQTTLYSKITPETPGTTAYTSGGNVIITSGTILAVGGGHAAGIGGPHRTNGTYYNGIIMIYGGIVTAAAGSHGAGVGSGCPTGYGVVSNSGGASTIIAIPPSSVRAYTNQGTPPDYYGLAGARDIAYIGDPQSPTHFTVYTEDFKETTMFLDLSQNPRIETTINTLAAQFNPKRLYLGETQVYGPGTTLIGGFYPHGGLDRLDGNLWTYPAPYNTLDYDFTGQYILQNAAMFNTGVTFYTSQHNPKGYEYTPETRAFSAGTTFTQTMVELKAPIYKPTLEGIPAVVVAPDTSALVYGYDSAEALSKATTLRICNDGNQPLYNLTLQLEAGEFTAGDGGSLYNAIVDSVNTVLLTDAKGDYLPPGVCVDVPALLPPGLEPGLFAGQVLFGVSDAPAGSLSPIQFTARVVRFLLNPPVLTTDPPGMTETNGPFDVIATFDQLVKGVSDMDIYLNNGIVMISSWTPVGTPQYFPPDATPYYTTYRFTVDTTGTGIQNNDVIQLWARSGIAYESHSVRTTDISNVLQLKLNLTEPYATFHFVYDLPLDSVFLSAQDDFTFTITANGTNLNPVTRDSVHLGPDWATGTRIQDLTSAALQSFITINKWDVAGMSLGAVSPSDWTVAVNADNTFTVTHVNPGGFDEGDYEVVLAQNAIYNNGDNPMGQTIGKFRVRLPILVPGPNCGGGDPDIGYGIEPQPTSLGFLGGEVRFVVSGRYLNFAHKANALQLELPAELGGLWLRPDSVNAAGDQAYWTLNIPGNNTTAALTHVFNVLMFGTTAPTDPLMSCSVTNPTGRITLASAPPVVITNPPACTSCPTTSLDAWAEGCEKKFTAYIPDTGFDREVTITYLGLAEKYLYTWGGGHPEKIILPAGKTYLEFIFLMARVPDNLNGGTGAIVISTPALPADTSAYFKFWNTPDLSEMVYYPRSTLYEGVLELNIRGGSPDLLRSLDHGITWESAWLPITPLQIQLLAEEDAEIRFQEPGGCRTFSLDFPTEYTGLKIMRLVVLPENRNVVTVPGYGHHFIKSGDDFVFTLNLTGPFAGKRPEVSTDRKLAPDSVYLTHTGENNYSVRIPGVREPINVIIKVDGVDVSTDSEYVELARVWASGGQLYVTSTTGSEASIYSVTGALVKTFSTISGQTTAVPLAAGFYMVTFDGRTYKIIIR